MTPDQRTGGFAAPCSFEETCGSDGELNGVEWSSRVRGWVLIGWLRLAGNSMGEVAVGAVGG
jgi:hypothetical protein